MSIRVNRVQKQRDTTALRDTCAACGNPKTETDPLVIAYDGFRVHKSHHENPATGYYGRPYKQDRKAS